MKVYRPHDESRPFHRLFVTPAAEVEGEGNAEWRNLDGTAITFTVEFKHGRADVPSHIGRFLVERGYAQETKLILPPGVAA